MKKIILIFVLLLLPIICEARTINTIIIHHSNSPDVSVATIMQWHKARGFRTCGYHFVIRADGTIEKGRSVSQQGAHAKNRNKHSIGICLTGYSKFTEAQKTSLEHLLEELCYGRTLKIERHTEKCPGKGLNVEAITLRVQFGSVIDSSGYASHYRDFKTASGYNMYLHPFAKTAASWFYPIGTKLRILYKNKEVDVVVRDVGPSKELVKQGRIIDLSPSAFKQLSPLDTGIIYVGIERIK